LLVALEPAKIVIARPDQEQRARRDAVHNFDGLVIKRLFHRFPGKIAFHRGSTLQRGRKKIARLVTIQRVERIATSASVRFGSDETPALCRAQIAVSVDGRWKGLPRRSDE